MPLALLFLPLLRGFSLIRGGAVNFAKWAFSSLTHLLAGVVVVLALVALWQHHEAGKQALYARQTKAAWEAARRDAAVAQAQAQARYRSLADEADQKYASTVAESGMRLAAYVAAHRLRPMPQTDPARAAQSGAAAIPAIAPAQAVLVEVSDLKACDADYTYAKAAHDWAAGLNGQN